MNISRRPTKRMPILLFAALLLLTCAFIQPQVAQAQWATSGTNTTTTDTVGIGTTTPGKKFEIFTSTSADGIKLNDGTVGSLWGTDTTNSGHFMGTLTSSPFYIITNGNSRL